MPTPHLRYRLDPRAILSGIGLGFMLVLAVVLSFLVADFSVEGIGPVLFMILLIYFPTGFVAGASARQRSLRHSATLFPPVLHALIASGLLILIHTLLLYAVHRGIGPPFEWLLVDALVATAFSMVAGLFGDLYACHHPKNEHLHNPER